MAARDGRSIPGGGRGLAVGSCSSNGRSSVASCFAKHAAAGPGRSHAGRRGQSGGRGGVDAARRQPAEHRGMWPAPSPALMSRNWAWRGACRSSRTVQPGPPDSPTGTRRRRWSCAAWCTRRIFESNVMAIRLATGQVLWTHNYSSPNGGPDGVNVVGGTVYAATNHAAVALSAARPAVAPDADRQRPRGHRHGARVQPRHGVRLDRAGQPDRRPVPRRRQVRPCGR